MSGGWSTGLLDCFSDCNVCKRSFYSLPFPSSCRTKLRGQYMLEEKPCNDCCVHLFCNPCAWCQEYRELQNRGFDVAIGWNGNASQNCGVVTAPALQGGMNRQSDHK